jgi:hypothetical protein
VTHPTSFTTASGGTSSVNVAPVKPQFTSITITQPAMTTVAGTTLNAGEQVGISWKFVGTIPLITLAYTFDRGVTTYPIASGLQSDSYTWTIPRTLSGTLRFVITGNDLIATLGTLESDAYEIAGTEIEEEVVEEKEDDDHEDLIDLPVKASDYPVVYFIDDTFLRHPYINAQTYFTWYETFSPIVTTELDTIATYTIGRPVLPKPGTVLVKIMSDPRVYAIEENPDDSTRPLLRWIPDEATAIALYGSAWADSVIDIEPTFIRSFVPGDVMTIDDDIDASTLLTRDILAEREK